jgi:hypothetical protein
VLVAAGREDASFWSVLGAGQTPSDVKLPASAPGLRQLQMQAAALQHVVAELSAAVEDFADLTIEHSGEETMDTCITLEGTPLPPPPTFSGALPGGRQRLSRRRSEPPRLVVLEHLRAQDAELDDILSLAQARSAAPIELHDAPKAHEELLVLLRALARKGIPFDSPLSELVCPIGAFAARLHKSARSSAGYGEGGDCKAMEVDSGGELLDGEELLEAEEMLLARIHEVSESEAWSALASPVASGTHIPGT